MVQYLTYSFVGLHHSLQEPQFEKVFSWECHVGYFEQFVNHFSAPSRISMYYFNQKFSLSALMNNNVNVFRDIS